MAFKDRLKRLERGAKQEMIEIPQGNPDGSIARFPQSAGMEALLDLMDGKDHPLAVAARNSEDPLWSKSFYNMFPLEDVEDLSEP